MLALKKDKPKLHGHGYILLLNGIIKCKLCNSLIYKHENLHKHAYNDSHKLAYQKKQDGGLKLFQHNVLGCQVLLVLDLGSSSRQCTGWTHSIQTEKPDRKRVVPKLGSSLVTC